MDHHVRAGEVVAVVWAFVYMALHWLGVHIGAVASALSAVYTLFMLCWSIYDKLLRSKRRRK